jgi:competence protein ComEC
LWPHVDVLAAGACRLTVIDVGQGLSVLVETASHTLLYDTGPVFGSGTTVAELAILPLLQYRGVVRLDALVVSHRDSDHAGGWRSIRRQVPVARMLVGDALGAADETPCRDGQHWRWDAVDFRMLYPAQAGRGGNDNSCVLQIGRGGAAILLTGDIERAAERQLLRRRRLARVAVLQVPHHGSRTSSSDAFVARVRPQYAVFSSGYRNRFHHPHPQVVARYRRAGAKTFNTARSGALIFLLRDGRVTQVAEQRERRRRYWQE